MAANLNLARLPITFLSANRFFQIRSSSVAPISSTLPSKTLSLTLDFQYGPSLNKGIQPSPAPNLSSENQQHDPPPLDRDSFSRVFQIAALRVPADQCFSLESRLRGHLLNWPRVRNIARVPGDDIDADFKTILPLSSAAGEDEAMESVIRRIYGNPNGNGEGERLSPVLYREKLAKSFNCRGFLKFRNLAKISRPKKSKKRKEKKREGVEEGVKRVGRNDFAVVVVVGEEGEEDNDGDLSGLLGDDFKGGRWRGPTRLLLLDERYANRGVDQLPEAVKVDLS